MLIQDQFGIIQNLQMSPIPQTSFSVGTFLLPFTARELQWVPYNIFHIHIGLRCLRDHIDGHNKHIVRLAEKDVFFGDKKYKYFAMQSTGGGTFPSQYTHPETALNVFKANIIPILGLDRNGIEYDILQVRSCARGVTAQNAFRMSAPASNMVMVYGLGGKNISILSIASRQKWGYMLA